ncbi:MAG: hypothetical protein ACLRP6_00125 [Bacteroides uniformis]
MTKNTYVKIIASPELSRNEAWTDWPAGEDWSWRTCPVKTGKTRAGWYLLEEAYMDEFVWFIPEKSVII